MHRELESITARRRKLAERVEVLTAGPRAQDCCTELLEDLLEYCALEQKSVLAAFAAWDALEAARLVEEHEGLRIRALALLTATRSGQLRPELVRDFATILEAHSVHEESVLCRWAVASRARGLPAAARGVHEA